MIRYQAFVQIDMSIPEKGIPAEIFSKLNEPQFKPGDAVCFTWFNVKRYGYVKTFKEVNWGIQYTVTLGRMSYPCGIEVNGWKTKYVTGLIQYDETIKLGQSKTKSNAESADPMYQTVTYRNESSNDTGVEPETTRSDSGDDSVSNEKPMGTKRDSNKVNKVRGGDVTKHSNKRTTSKTGGHSNPDVTELGDAGMHPSDQPIGIKTRKTKKSSVEIDKNILSNFFKNI